MLLDNSSAGFGEFQDVGVVLAGPWGRSAATEGQGVSHPLWTVVLPFHNERDFLPLSVGSLLRQTVPFRLILVDNGSTDGGGEIAARLARSAGIDTVLLTEWRPGKVAALQCGVDATRTDYLATCDADTIYPDDYLERAGKLLARKGVAAAVAATAAPEASKAKRRMAGLHLAIVARLLPQQCLNGGAGQVFCTEALRAAGGFDPVIWNWVLEDHEIMARVERQGRIAYDRHFLCAPITRPRSVSTVGWNTAEQIRYHSTRSASRFAFFHDFLGPRLRQRALSSDRLRREDRQDIATLYPVRG